MDATPQDVAQHAEHAPSVGFSAVETTGPDSIIDYKLFTAGYHLWLPPILELAAGGRVGIGENIASGSCFEGFVSIGVAPRFDVLRDDAGRTGSWKPALAIEVGVTSARSSFDDVAPDHFLRSTPRPGPLYAQWFARPLRFRLSPFDASILGLGLGTHLREPGRTVRIELEILQVGLVL